MPFKLMTQLFRGRGTWETSNHRLRPLGNVSYGMFSPAPGADRTGEESSIFYVESPTTSTGLPWPSKFTIESQSIIFGLLRGTDLSLRLVRSMASSTFSHQRWRRISTSSTRYGVKYRLRSSGVKK